MKRFIALYFLFLAILFTFIHADSSTLSTNLTDVQRALALVLINLFLDSSQLQGIGVWINHSHYKIIIKYASNGMIPYFFCSLPSFLSFRTI